MFSRDVFKARVMAGADKSVVVFKSTKEVFNGRKSVYRITKVDNNNDM